jgi:hypothetical protein
MKFYKGMKFQNISTGIVATLEKYHDKYPGIEYWAVSYDGKYGHETWGYTEEQLQWQLDEKIIRIYENGIEKVKRRHNL